MAIQITLNTPTGCLSLSPFKQNYYQIIYEIIRIGKKIIVIAQNSQRKKKYFSIKERNASIGIWNQTGKILYKFKCMKLILSIIISLVFFMLALSLSQSLNSFCIISTKPLWWKNCFQIQLTYT